MKKIVFYAHNLELGGIEKALISLLKNIDYNKYSVHLILEDKIGDLLFEVPKTVKISEYKISNQKNIFFRKIFNRIKLFSHIIINYHKYDFSCAYIPYSIPGSILMRYYSKNNSYYIHSDYYSLYMNDLAKTKQFFLKHKITKFKTVFVVSNEIKNSLLKQFKLKNIVVCGNLIEGENIIKLSNEKIAEKKPKVCLFISVSRHEEESKKITRMIESAKILKDRNFAFELWLIGNGKDSNKYAELINEYNLNKNVKLIGSKNNPYPYFKISDVIVMTSDYEGFPVVYLEALLFNLPIITTIPVSNSFLDIKNYALICEKNVWSIVKNMEKFINNKSQRNKKHFNYIEYNKSNLNKFLKIVDKR